MTLIFFNLPLVLEQVCNLEFLKSLNAKFDGICLTNIIYTNVQIYFLKSEFEQSKQMINSIIHLSTAMYFQFLLFKRPETSILINRMTYPVLYNQNSHLTFSKHEHSLYNHHIRHNVWEHHENTNHFTRIVSYSYKRNPLNITMKLSKQF